MTDMVLFLVLEGATVGEQHQYYSIIGRAMGQAKGVVDLFRWLSAGWPLNDILQRVCKP